jgi:hypothetical protein
VHKPPWLSLCLLLEFPGTGSFDWMVRFAIFILSPSTLWPDPVYLHYVTLILPASLCCFLILLSLPFCLWVCMWFCREFSSAVTCFAGVFPF